jgi:hypothetical protein
MPLCPGLEHSVIVTRISCPLGSAGKMGELTISSPAADRLSRVAVSLQPFLFVKLSAYKERTTLVSVSATVIAMDRNVIPPVFSSSTSTHQPVPAQLSSPL